MKKAQISLLCVFLLVGLLTGCSLAAEDGDLQTGGDRLVGMFLTTEYVDTVDWSNVDISDVIKDGTVSGSQEKIYGRFDRERKEYVFEGLEGYSLGIMRLKDEEDEEYLISAVSACFADVNLNIGDRENTCSGILYYDQTQIASEYVTYEDESYKEIYKDQDIVVNNVVQEDGSEVYEVCADGKELKLYGNAVYETQDETIYLVPGNGVLVGADGGDLSVTLSDTVTEVDNSRKTETKNTVQATYRGACPIQSVKFSWQDKSGETLKEESFVADEIPSSIKWGEETAYILVTLQKTDKTAEYGLISEEDETYRLYTAGQSADSLILQSAEVTVERR